MEGSRRNPTGWYPKEAMEKKRRRRFERMVEACLDSLPKELMSVVENLVFQVADEPSGNHDVLGEYFGVPRSQRSAYSMALPDRIVLYRKPLEKAARSVEELRHEIYRTLVHEIAHHLGMNEEEILKLLGPDYA